MAIHVISHIASRHRITKPPLDASLVSLSSSSWVLGLRMSLRVHTTGADAITTRKVPTGASNGKIYGHKMTRRMSMAMNQNMTICFSRTEERSYRDLSPKASSHQLQRIQLLLQQRLLSGS